MLPVLGFELLYLVGHVQAGALGVVQPGLLHPRGGPRVGGGDGVVQLMAEHRAQRVLRVLGDVDGQPLALAVLAVDASVLQAVIDDDGHAPALAPLVDGLEIRQVDHRRAPAVFVLDLRRARPRGSGPGTHVDARPGCRRLVIVEEVESVILSDLLRVLPPLLVRFLRRRLRRGLLGLGLRLLGFRFRCLRRRILRGCFRRGLFGLLRFRRLRRRVLRGRFRRGLFGRLRFRRFRLVVLRGGRGRALGRLRILLLLRRLRALVLRGDLRRFLLGPGFRAGFLLGCLPRSFFRPGFRLRGVRPGLALRPFGRTVNRRFLQPAQRPGPLVGLLALGGAGLFLPAFPGGLVLHGLLLPGLLALGLTGVLPLALLVRPAQVLLFRLLVLRVLLPVGALLLRQRPCFRLFRLRGLVVAQLALDFIFLPAQALQCGLTGLGFVNFIAKGFQFVPIAVHLINRINIFSVLIGKTLVLRKGPLVILFQPFQRLWVGLVVFHGCVQRACRFFLYCGQLVVLLPLPVPFVLVLLDQLLQLLQARAFLGQRLHFLLLGGFFRLRGAGFVLPFALLVRPAQVFLLRLLVLRILLLIGALFLGQLPGLGLLRLRSLVVAQLPLGFLLPLLIAQATERFLTGTGVLRLVFQLFGVLFQIA